MKPIVACAILLALLCPAFGDELNGFKWKEWEKYGISFWVSDKEAAFEGLSIPEDLIKTVFVLGYMKGFDEARHYILDEIRMTRRKFRDEYAKVVWANAMARVRFAIVPLSRIEADTIVERLNRLYSDYDNLTIKIEDAIFNLLEEYSK
jgi:hypothetical protein